MKKTKFEATRDWLWLVDDLVFLTKGEGLDFCRNVKTIEDIGAVRAVRFGLPLTPEVIAKIGALPVPKSFWFKYVYNYICICFKNILAKYPTTAREAATLSCEWLGVPPRYCQHDCKTNGK